MITADKFVQQAKAGKYLGIPYSRLDCQAFVEQVLKDAGEKGHNWRGSNHMWRDALSISFEGDFSGIVPGAWVFTLKHDGGERARGYNDGCGNAKHVGIYLGNGDVMHSTSANGACVQMDKITSDRWTAWGLCKYIDYSGDSDRRAAVLAALELIKSYVMEVENHE